MPGPDPRYEGRWLDSAGWPVRARRLGPLRYSDLGRRALEIVAPSEVVPLARWLSRFADTCWERAGRPDPWTLVVVSGDNGSLARALLDLEPRCGPALRYVLVDPDRAVPEVGAGPPADMARRVPLENPAFLYPVAAEDQGAEAGGEYDGEYLDAGERPVARGVGPLATFLTERPDLGERDGAVVAIGVLSRLPFDLYEHDGERWRELRLAAGPEGSGTQEVAVELPPGTTVAAPPGPAPGHEPARYRDPTGATAWLRTVLAGSSGGRLAVVDDWAPDPVASPSVAPGPSASASPSVAPGPSASPLHLRPLGLVREPEVPGPEPVAGTSLSVVTWRLG